MKKPILLVFALMAVLLANAQITFNASFGDINFGDSTVTITNKVGDGTSTGDIILYQNVAYIDSQQIDAIVRTIEINNGYFTNFDNPSTSGASMSNNQARFFSPQLYFNSGGGHVQFRFEFILGGSYDNSIDSGTTVTLYNTMINTYDIDGNGSSGTNQYNEFGGFDSSSLASNTKINSVYNGNSGLTRFRSNFPANVSNILDERTRVRVSYLQISSFSIRAGSDGQGDAFFFLDFGPGGYWTPDVFDNPTLDLDTSTNGNNRIDTFCNSPTRFTKGGTNVGTPGGTVDEIIISINKNMLYDGSDELLVIQGAGSGDSIELNFTHGAGIPNISLGGITYTVTATVTGNTSTLRFAKYSGLMTTGDAEKFLDSLSYFNRHPTTGYRTFNVSVREGSFTSPDGSYQLLVSCSVLPIELMQFKLTKTDESQILIEWTTASETNCSHFILEKQMDVNTWVPLMQIPGNGTTQKISHYSFRDSRPAIGVNCYRLVQYDFNGNNSYSTSECLHLRLDPGIVILYPNPTKGIINLNCVLCDRDQLEIFNSDGSDVLSEVELKSTESGYLMDLMSLPNGIYYLHVRTDAEIIVKRFTVMH